MAKQGNYVTLPNIDPNWGKGLSASLMDLSDMYAKQEEAKREEARLAAQDAESRRRFNLQEARYAQDRADSLAQRDLENKRWEAQNKRDIELYNQKQDEYKTALAAKESLREYDPSFDFNAIRETKPELAQQVENIVAPITAQLTAADNLFTGNEAGFGDRATAYIDAMEKLQGKPLTDLQRADVMGNLTSVMDDIRFADDKEAALSSAYDKLGLNKLKENRDQLYANAPKALTAEEAVGLHTQRIMASNPNIDRATAINEAKAIVAANNRKSYSDILAERQASATAYNEAADATRQARLDYADFVLDQVKTIGTKGSSFNTSGDIEKDILAIKNIHPNIDEDEFNQLSSRYRTLLGEGYSANAAMAATAASFQPGAINDTILPLAEAEQFARDINDLRGSSPSAAKLAQFKEDYFAVPEYKSADMAGWKASRWGDRSILNANVPTEYDALSNRRVMAPTQYEQMMNEAGNFSDYLPTRNDKPAVVATNTSSTAANVLPAPATEAINNVASAIFTDMFSGVANNSTTSRYESKAQGYVNDYLISGDIPRVLQNKPEIVAKLEALKPSAEIKAERAILNANRQAEQTDVQGITADLAATMGISPELALRTIEAYQVTGVIPAPVQNNPEAMKLIKAAANP